MTNPNQPRLATEKMQSDFTLFNELSTRLGELRKSKMTKEDIKNTSIDDLIFKHTGIKIVFVVEDLPFLNAVMSAPVIDKNHPFMVAGNFNYPIDKNSRKYLKNNDKKVVEVWVDESNYTVGGAWSKVPITITLTKYLLKFRKLEDGSLAAIFLHELGHAFTYFSLFGKMYTKNFLTDEAIKDLLSDEPLEKRVQSLEFLEDKLQLNIKNKEQIAQAPEKIRADLAESIIVTESAANIDNLSKYSNYDIRNIEQIADQFAIYHGAGPYLALGEIEINKYYGDSSVLSGTSFVIEEILKVLIFGFLSAKLPLLGILLLILYVPGNKVYDSPAARTALMKKQLIASLKTVKGNPDLYKTILGQIKTYEQLEGILNDRRTFYTLVYQTISPRGRVMYRQEVFMKAVENLLYSDTYLNAAKFGALTK